MKESFVCSLLWFIFFVLEMLVEDFKILDLYWVNFVGGILGNECFKYFFRNFDFGWILGRNSFCRFGYSS